MRKNKMMRLASVLLVLTLLTTCMISGTFAKYVTTASGNDSARVAKWGITMDMEGKDTFTDSYTTGSDTNVKANGTDALVAPGTFGTVIYEVKGAPETAYSVTFNGTADNDVYLAKDLTFAYTDDDAEGNGAVAYAALDADGKVDADYYPIYYTVKITAANGSFTLKTGATGEYIDATDSPENFDTLDAAMKALNNTVVTYAPNEDAAMTVTINWNWAFDNSTTPPTGMTAINDTYDTVLGDIVAQNADLKVDGSAPTDAEVEGKYDTQIAYTLDITATQID